MAEKGTANLSMLDLFRSEVQTHADTLSKGLQSTDDALTSETLESMLRAAHSVKGAARLVNVAAAVELARAIEECLLAIQSQEIDCGADARQALQKGVDCLMLISQLSAEEQTGFATAHKDSLDPVLGQITDLKTKTSSKATAPAKAPEPKSKPVPTELADSSMLDLFRIEAESNTSVLTDGLLALEKSPGATDRLETLMRAAHSIKGAARLVNLTPAVEVAHVMEDCFVAAQQGRLSLNADSVDVLLRGVDMLSKIAQSPGDALEQWQTLATGLVDALQGVLRGEPPKNRAELQAAPSAPEARAPQPAPAGSQATGTQRVVRISADRVNRLMGLAGEMTVTAGWVRGYADSMLSLKKRQTELIGIIDKLRTVLDESVTGDLGKGLLVDAQTKADDCRQNLAARLAELEEFDRRSSSLAGRLNHEIIASRMRPFADGVQGFQRMVRDLGRTLDKKVELEIAGLDTQVDRDILEKIEAPLNHILRNAVDHGIESPEERLAAGKPECGTIRLEAMHSAGMLSIIVTDDGRGVDLDRLKRKIIEKNMTSAAMADDLSEAELLDFLFLPAFSTRDKVTEVSGRGVGLDVVHNAVQEMRGQIRAQTTLSKGLRLHLQLPLTLSVIRSLLVTIGDELYAFPLARVERILQLARAEIRTLEDRQYVNHEGQHIGLVDAAQVLGLESDTQSSPQIPVVVIGDRSSSYGLVVERFLGERDLVVQAMDPRLGKVKDISAAAITADGQPLLILDVDDVLRSIEDLISGKRLHKVKRNQEEQARSNKRVLVVDDSLTVREVEKKLLVSRGYDVDVAVDGMDGWNTVRLGDYDLVISDIDMPRMNGIEFVKLIKSHAKLKSTPVMIVSYKDRQEDRERGLEAGADYYLAKGSFHDETLIDAVVDLIGEAHT